MATVIKFMLQVTPQNRPSCDQILALPIVESLSKKFYAEDNERHKLDENTIEKEQKLLKTIRISRNLFSLTERLPKSKYQSPSHINERNIERSLERNHSSAANIVPPGSQGDNQTMTVAKKRDSIAERSPTRDINSEEQEIENNLAIHKRNNSIGQVIRK
jgi:hypothetical protein